MKPALAEAIVVLADVLARENAALQALDVRLATALLPEKEAATARFQDVAKSAREQTGADVDTEPAAARLLDAARENRRLLERAMLVQKRMLAIVVSAVPAAMPQVGRYGTGGRPVGPSVPPVMVSARV